MAERWTLRYHAKAVQGIYRVERGLAAEVTAAIFALAADPLPELAQPVEERANTYQLRVAGYIVEYELQDRERLVKVLFVE